MTVQSEKRNTVQRRLPIGAEVLPGGGAHFRVWAPARKRVELIAAESADGLATAQRRPLAAESGGYFSAAFDDVVPQSLYAFLLDGQLDQRPDPASRYQPFGPHGPSQLVDPSSYRWRDGAWRGIELAGQVLYELHIGTFTPEGTWRAAAARLNTLAEIGITTVEMMPIADFTGEFGWGYDGVNLFAPTRLYGQPDDLRYFIDEAHRLGMGVILDVVYNHFGPTGNYLGQFSRDYVSSKHHTEWGEAINFDGPACGPVREFFLANAGYWVEEYHFDGLRLDAVHAIVDDSPDHILAAVAREVRARSGGRQVLVTAENDFQQACLIRSAEQGGYGLDAAWNDDFHHAARVAMTGHSEGYYLDFLGSPQELISAVKWGYLYQGHWNPRRGYHRGSPALDVEGPRFITFLENHDQVANSPQARHCHQLTSPGRHRALSAVLLLGPGTPLLFQGQEFSSTTPFFFFADHEPDLRPLVSQGRQQSMRQFRSRTGHEATEYFADPCDGRTFERSKLNWRERDANSEALALHRDLLRLRREDPVFAAQRADRIHGAVLGQEAFVLRFFGPAADDRLLLVNLGRSFECWPASEPLLAPPEDKQWEPLWSSEHPRYGGIGTGEFDPENWYLPGHAALVLRAAPSP